MDLWWILLGICFMGTCVLTFVISLFLRSSFSYLFFFFLLLHFQHRKYRRNRPTNCSSIYHLVQRSHSVNKPTKRTFKAYYFACLLPFLIDHTLTCIRHNKRKHIFGRFTNHFANRESLPERQASIEHSFLHDTSYTYLYKYGVDLTTAVAVLDPLSELATEFDGVTPTLEFDDFARHQRSYQDQFDVDLDTFVAKLNPLATFQALRTLNHQPLHLESSRDRSEPGNQHHQACVAAFNLQHGCPTSERHYYDQHQLPTVYLSRSEQDNLPIVIDTGASVTLTPNVNDFIGPIEPCDLLQIHGLADASNVSGAGLVKWTVIDVFGCVRTLRTWAYYVPSATIRLFSPQTYFKENPGSSLYLDSSKTVLTTSDHDELEIPFSPNNLPLLLPAPPQSHLHQAGVSFEDYNDFASFSFLNVSAAANLNLTAASKEYLLWHAKLGHAHQGWVQSLLAEPAVEGRCQVIQPKHKQASTCSSVKCTACCIAKAHRRSTESKSTTPTDVRTIKKDDPLPSMKPLSITTFLPSAVGSSIPPARNPRKIASMGASFAVTTAASTSSNITKFRSVRGKHSLASEPIANSQLNLVSNSSTSTLITILLAPKNSLPTAKPMVKQSATLASALITRMAKPKTPSRS